MNPANPKIYNAPSLKFLAALEVVQHTSNLYKERPDNYDKLLIKVLPIELREYLQFMDRNPHLFKKKENIKLEFLPKDLDTQEILDAACASGDLDEKLLQDLFALNSNLNLNGNDKHITPLMWTAMRGKVSVMETLIQKGADVHYQPRPGFTPILAVTKAIGPFSESHVKALQVLLAHNIHIDSVTEDHDTPLTYLCDQIAWDRETDEIPIKLLELLLQHGTNINHQAEKNETALMKVCYVKDPTVLTILLKHNPNLELVDNNNRTAFIIAAVNENLHALYVLKNAGANINHMPMPNSGSTAALAFATHTQNVLLVSTLSYLGASTEIPDAEGNTPLFIATARNNFDIVKLLLEKGAHPNAPDRRLNISLMIALQKKNFQIAKLLLKYTREFTIADLYPFIPGLNQLVESEKTEILQEIMDKGLFKHNTRDTQRPKEILIHSATPAMKKLLVNYRTPEYYQSPWPKRMLFELKEFYYDHPKTAILGGVAATTIVGTGIWYCLKNKESRLIQ